MKKTIIISILTLVASVGLGQSKGDTITMTKPDSIVINGKPWPCRCFKIITVPSDSVRYYEAKGWISDKIRFQKLKPVKQ